ncbi:MAG: conjugal transfer protein TraS [Caldimonas sp.]
MVKVTGGGRGMAAIAAHLRYISKNGRLPIEDDRGVTEQSKDALKEIERQWRFGGAYIDEVGHRREAFNIMLSMPRGTNPLGVLRAAREFAKLELADHRYVMVLHEHQANPHVHLSVKAESKHGTRLNPRKADLRRWRETFAEQLREQGIDAEASRQATRGGYRRQESLWRIKALEDGRLHSLRSGGGPGASAKVSRDDAHEAWRRIAMSLANSDNREDQLLATQIAGFVRDASSGRKVTSPQQDVQRTPARSAPERSPQPSRLPDAGRSRSGPEMER